MSLPSLRPLHLWGPAKNVLNLLVQLRFWFSVCSRYKKTHTCIHTRAHHPFVLPTLCQHCCDLEITVAITSQKDCVFGVFCTLIPAVSKHLRVRGGACAHLLEVYHTRQAFTIQNTQVCSLFLSIIFMSAWQKHARSSMCTGQKWLKWR